MGIETLLLGLVSVLFSLVNVTNIFIGALLLLKVRLPLATNQLHLHYNLLVITLQLDQRDSTAGNHVTGE